MPPTEFADIPFREWPHHLAHAASAFFCAGWDEALVIVADGAGENACTSAYVGKGRTLRRIGEEVLPNSLGHYYSAITEHLGFEPFADEFKVMGLAAYGTPRFSDDLGRVLQLRDHGRYTVDIGALKSLSTTLPGHRDPGEPVEQIHMDIAKSAQVQLEHAIIHIVSHHQRTTGLRRLCLAGGTFLNCVANGKLAATGLFDEIFVQPAASDAGTALGAAALSTIRRGGPAQLRYPSFALGTEYRTERIRTVLSDSGIDAEQLDDRAMIERLADRLANGDVCAVFRGRMEFGPRALGMRSLLASPTDPGMRDRLNRIKGREEFRPVAPILTEEAFSTYFDGHRDRYMLFATRVREHGRATLPSAVHADGTARVQTVRYDDDQFLHALLTAFGNRTGHPVLINTSFNVRGKPIIEAPSDALACFFSSDVQCLALGDSFVDKVRSPVQIGG